MMANYLAFLASWLWRSISGTAGLASDLALLAAAFWPPIVQFVATFLGWQIDILLSEQALIRISLALIFVGRLTYVADNDAQIRQVQIRAINAELDRRAIRHDGARLLASQIATGRALFHSIKSSHSTPTAATLRRVKQWHQDCAAVIDEYCSPGDGIVFRSFKEPPIKYPGDKTKNNFLVAIEDAIEALEQHFGKLS